LNESASEQLESPFLHLKTQKLSLLGGLISMVNLAMSIMFNQRTVFESPRHYRLYQAALLVRLCLVLATSLYMLFRHYFKYQVQAEIEARVRQLRRRGLALYWSLPFNLWFGSYRTFLVKDFIDLIMLNLLIECGQSVPTLVIGLKYAL